MTNLKLSAAHNWCDRRCERCPLWRECPVSTSQFTTAEALEQAVTMIEQVCHDEGIDTDALPPPPPPGPIELALQRAALEWARTYSAIVGWDATALVLVGKIARTWRRSAPRSLRATARRSVRSYPRVERHHRSHSADSLVATQRKASADQVRDRLRDHGSQPK